MGAKQYSMKFEAVIHLYCEYILIINQLISRKNLCLPSHKILTDYHLIVEYLEKGH